MMKANKAITLSAPCRTCAQQRRVCVRNDGDGAGPCTTCAYHGCGAACAPKDAGKTYYIDTSSPCFGCTSRHMDCFRQSPGEACLRCCVTERPCSSLPSTFNGLAPDGQQSEETQLLEVLLDYGSAHAPPVDIAVLWSNIKLANDARALNPEQIFRRRLATAAAAAAQPPLSEDRTPMLSIALPPEQARPPPAPLPLPHPAQMQLPTSLLPLPYPLPQVAAPERMSSFGGGSPFSVAASSPQTQNMQPGLGSASASPFGFGAPAPSPFQQPLPAVSGELVGTVTPPLAQMPAAAAQGERSWSDRLADAKRVRDYHVGLYDNHMRLLSAMQEEALFHKALAANAQKHVDDLEVLTRCGNVAV